MTPKQVAEIRSYLRLGVPNVVLATKYNISKQIITDIKVGRIWKDVEPDEGTLRNGGYSDFIK